MRKAIFLTAYNRVAYLQQVLHTWESVRGAEDWDFVAMIEPSELSHQILEEFKEFETRTTFRSVHIQINPERYGVLHHPWVGFESLFMDTIFHKAYEFVVRAEDDLIVSTDILEYFSWAANAFQNDLDVATVNAYNREDSGSASEVELADKFSPWVWGTWADRWVDYIGTTWDHNYSTFNGIPGRQAGWDWNLDTRILPSLEKVSARPLLSRVDNIGVFGIHGTPENFETSESFQLDRKQEEFEMVDGR